MQKGNTKSIFWVRTGLIKNVDVTLIDKTGLSDPTRI